MFAMDEKVCLALSCDRYELSVVLNNGESIVHEKFEAGVTLMAKPYKILIV